MNRKFGRLLLIMAALAAAAFHPATALTTSGGAIAPPDAPFDMRARGVVNAAPTSAQREAARTLTTKQPGVRLAWSPRFGTPESVQRFGSTLSAASSAEPASIAKSWLRANTALYGWKVPDVDRLTVEKTLTQPGNGPRIVLLHQTFEGLHGGSFGGSIVVSLDRAGRIVSVRSSVVRVPGLASGKRIDLRAAFARAAGLALADVPAIDGAVNGWTRIARGTSPKPHFARLAAFPVSNAAARPVYEIFHVERLDSGFRVAVDAITGEVLYRAQVASNAAPEGRVFRNYPGAPAGGTHEMMSFRGDPNASPAGWLSPIAGHVRLVTTMGNNALTATHLGSPTTPDGPGQLRPVTANGVFNDAFTDAWRKSDCGKVSAGGQSASGEPTYINDALPGVTSLFYHHNLMHDYFYSLGFTPEAGAMQANNFGRAGVPGDPLQGLVLNGAATSRNNAYMLTLPDGLPSWSGMFLFEAVAGLQVPCADGDFDAHVIYHEYAHGVTGRWVGAEYGNLDGGQGGAMGEAWSDFYGLNYLHEQGLEKRHMIGAYVTGDDSTGIRNYAANDNPLHYGDYDYDGSSVHSNGEIWSGALWDLRTALGQARGAGAKYAAQIIADAMPVSGPVPSFLNMRDAILASDVARTGGDYQSLIWSVFARRGMGFSAKTTGQADATPKAAFDHIDERSNGRVEMRVVDPISGRPVWGAEILAGEVETSTPLAVVPRDGRVSLKMAAGAQTFVVRVRGYGSRVVRITIPAGRKVITKVALEPNYASSATGAKIVAGSAQALRVGSIIDDSRFSTGVLPLGSDAHATIELGGSAPVDVNEVRVSAGPSARALDRFDVQYSVDGQNFRPLVSGKLGRKRPFAVGTLDREYRSWILRKPVRATHVRIVARSTQIPGEATAEIAEVQVFGSGDWFAVQATTPVEFTDEGSLAAATPLDPSVNQFSPTRLAMTQSCTFPPPTQGVDAWVTQMSPTFWGARIEVRAPDFGGEDLLPEFDVYFLDDKCAAISFLAVGPQPSEIGFIPSGTAYVLTHHYAGPPTDITLKATTPGQRVVRLGSPPSPKRR